MMKLFKRKKSDGKIAHSSLLSEPSIQENSTPKEPAMIVMPKPRRILTPTRAILNGFDREKTEVEESEGRRPLEWSNTKKENLLLVQSISHTLLDAPTSHEDDDHSRAYDSALETLSEQDRTQTPLPDPLPSSPAQPSPPAIVPSDETEQLLQALKAKVLWMEKQQALDRAEWQRKEKELLENRQEMMERLRETESQLKEALERRQAQLQRSRSEEQLGRRRRYSSSASHSPSATLVTSTPVHKPRAKSIDPRWPSGDPYLKPRPSYRTSDYYDDQEDEDDYYYPYRIKRYLYPMIYPAPRHYTTHGHSFYGYTQ
ncbi:hypothetical protein G6F46_011200 [Rhizopus delemar]|uniref:Uncharacterized protein n=2 Tax=Rhizopus TaxID=4842 RepID=A0A9P6YTM2_9FUNG|nr:hypothetical protein G6F55_010595 [Rhizopus delemar]KAG1535869.1 hypothetical protein G6F51_011292 [Rhizopus arrhizus]KAG1490229.1 hypothetical protein G6F54_010874 [Rhizopus delemar]KAG1500687.1 hypothetical protein G6F52_012538 [Rhizopus delemar]KAG1501718.1 hypothetical protein G6F53_011021 [Rhizopus delemar]